MSVQLIAWAYEQRVGSPTKKAVLLALANAANHHTGRCDPSIVRICEETELADRTVRRALVELCEARVISRERPRRSDGSLGRYRYVFPLVSSAAEPPVTESAGLPVTVTAEPEVNLEPEETFANDAKAPPQERPRNLIWDALTQVFGEATTESSRSRRGKVCRSLTAARASPEEIIQRARSWPRHFDDATLTETALEKHWDVLGRPPLRMR